MFCSVRIAVSRPEPEPLTITSSLRIPISPALRPACSAATCAAYGVDLRDPLKPTDPPDDHPTTFPSWSVMVMMVLLKLALMWACPCGMFRLVRRLRPPCCFATVPPLPYFVTFFLPAIGVRGPLRVRALVWVRWPRTGRPRRWRRPW